MLSWEKEKKPAATAASDRHSPIRKEIYKVRSLDNNDDGTRLQIAIWVCYIIKKLSWKISIVRGVSQKKKNTNKNKKRKKLN